MKKTIYLILCISLAVISCGIPTAFIRPVPGAISAPAPDVNRNTHINSEVSMVVIAIKAVNIREESSELSDDIGDLLNGQIVIVSEIRIIGESRWCHHKDGWTNCRFLEAIK